MIPPWFSEVCLWVLGNSLPLLPAFLAVLVGVACFFTPYRVSLDDGRVMLFYIASRGVGILLIFIGAFALWQAVA